MWQDPGFEEMLESSTLIAVVEVVEGGKFVCKVRVQDVLKGKDPGRPFLLGGYNNEHWPASGIEAESFKKGERLLAFLHPGRIHDPEKQEDESQGLGEGWFVPTPSTGDSRIVEGKLHGSWYAPSYPNDRPGVEAAMVLGIVRGYVLHREGKSPVEARKLIAAKLTLDLVRSVTEPPEEEEDEDEDEKKEDPKAKAEAAANASRLAILDWLLCAQAIYGDKELAPILLEAAKSKHPFLKILAGRALRSAGASTDARAALGALLLEPHSFIQAEAARALTLGGFHREDAVPLLLKALPESSGLDGGPRRVMDPLLNSTASGREMMVRALTHFEASREGHDALVETIRDEELTKGVFDALADHFLKYPSVAARAKFIALYRRCPEEAVHLFHRYLFREKSREALGAVGERVASGSMESYAVEITLRRLAKALPRDDRELALWINSVLKRAAAGSEDKDGPDDDFLPFALLAPTKEVAATVEKWPVRPRTLDDATQVAVLQEAVVLKLSTAIVGTARLARWIDLAERWDGVNGSPWATECLLEELGAATAEDLRSAAIAKIRKTEWFGSRAPGLLAVRRMGGKLTEEEAKGLEEYEAAEKRYLEEP